MAGMGKTRLAQQVGAESLPDHPAGVWFVDLSSSSTVDEVVAAIAAATDFKLRSSESSIDALANEIATRNLVLILDNCEHLGPPDRGSGRRPGCRAVLRAGVDRPR